MPSRPLEEIFVVLSFAPALNLVLANACEDIFVVLIFVAAELSTKLGNLAPYENFLLYGIILCHIYLYLMHRMI